MAQSQAAPSAELHDSFMRRQRTGKEEGEVSLITAKCPFCERLFLMPRPLFVGERELTACPACQAEAERNTETMEQEAKQKRSDSWPLM